MRNLAIVMIGAMAAQAATAQTAGPLAPPSAQSLRASIEFAQVDRYRPVGSQLTECLRERATGQLVCRTRAEWKQIARNIEQGRSWR